MIVNQHLTNKIKQIHEDPTLVAAIRDIFPTDWENLKDQQILKMSFSFKLLDLDWRSEEELVWLLTVLTQSGVVELNDDSTMIRRGSKDIIDKSLI